MKKKFELLNIKCEGCANRVKSALKDEFGEVEVDLTQIPRIITLDIEDSQIDTLRQKVKSLGYPFSDEDLNTISEYRTKTKSFVSCAIGKIDLKLGKE